MNILLNETFSLFINSINAINSVFNGSSSNIDLSHELDQNNISQNDDLSQKIFDHIFNKFKDQESFNHVLRAFKLSVQATLTDKGISKDDLIPQNEIDLAIVTAVATLTKMLNGNIPDRVFKECVNFVVESIKKKKPYHHQHEIKNILPSEDEISKIKFTDVDDAEYVEEKIDSKQLVATVGAILAEEEKAQAKEKDQKLETIDLNKMIPLSLNKRDWKRFLSNPVSIIENRRISIFDYSGGLQLDNLSAQQKDDLISAINQCFTKREIIKFLMKSKIVTKFRFRGIDNNDFTKPYFEAVTSDDKLIVLQHNLERGNKKSETTVFIARVKIKQEAAA